MPSGKGRAFRHWVGLHAWGKASGTGLAFRCLAYLQAQGLPSVKGLEYRHLELFQARGMPSGTRRGFRRREHFQARGTPSTMGLVSGTGSTFRYGERPYAQGVTSGTGSLCALRAQGAPRGTGLAIRHRVNSGKGCAITHGVHPQGVPVPFRQRECLQEQGVPSGMLSGFSNWRPVLRALGPGGSLL